MQSRYESHPATPYGENCPVCGAWEDEKSSLYCFSPSRECRYINPATGFHRDDTPVEEDGSCCGCGMI